MGTNHRFYVHPLIEKASTLPALFYRDPAVFKAMPERIFRPSWQVIPPANLPQEAEKAVAFSLLDGFLSTPLLISKDEHGHLHCLSNVCTHRGNLLISGRSTSRKLVCGYHGRRFGRDGKFEFMPEFEEVAGFPSACDHLPSFPLIRLGPLYFTSLEPHSDFSEIRDFLEERIGFLPLDQFQFDPAGSKPYDVQAHWALYCDNYLEGFHIPFVHKELDAVLDYGQYDTILHPAGCLQIGYAAKGEEAVFKLPPGHIDAGKQVAAYYFWLFPNLMLNFYPWGLSLNVVAPIDPSRSRVSFYSFVLDASRTGKGAGSGLDRVELEDEAVVEGVQQGLQSPYYHRGRFSPTREKGVHHFHRMLSAVMQN